MKHFNNSKQSRTGLLRKRATLLALALLAGTWSITAQSVVVGGRVVDTNAEPVIGAAVIETGTTNGTSTDAEGRYTLRISQPQASLTASCLGMEDTTVAVNGRTEVDITMRETGVAIEDVVVTALGIKRDARALGYAVSSVANDQLTAGNEQNVMMALAGKVAGVDISGTAGGPSGSTQVVIRGNSQLSGTNRPLYVIDGIPVDNTQFDALSGTGQYVEGYDYGDVMSSINTDDIENISVLKGASAAALYGSRASNGVILITTKSGASKKKGWAVELSSNFSIVDLANGLNDYQRVYGQGTNGTPTLTLDNASRQTMSAWGGKLDPNLTIPIFNGTTHPYANVDDNILSFFRTGFTYNNSVAISNSNEKTSFRVSIADMRNTDIIPNSGMDRTSVAVKGSSKIGKKLTLNAQATYTVEQVDNRPALANSSNNIGLALLGLAPNFDQAWLEEGYKDEYGTYRQWTSSTSRINPYWSLNEMSNQTSKHRLIGAVNLNFEIIEGLNLSAKMGSDYYNYKIREYAGVSTPNKESGEMTMQDNAVYENNYEVMLKYDKRFGDFDLSAFVGGNLMQYQKESVVNSGQGQVIPGWEDITNYSQKGLAHSLIRKEVRSFFGMASLGWRDLAYLEGTIRNDVSSTLAPDYRSYWYPSVSGSVILSNIFDMRAAEVSFFKIRGSWAKVGGDTSPYQLDLAYGLRDYTLGGFSLGEVQSTVVPFQGLKPTSTYSWEIGFDLRFFGNRLSVDFTYYDTRTKDQILQLPISATTGYNNAIVNAGEITNRGFEIQLSATPVKTRNFTWETDFNFSRNVNKVVSLDPSVSAYELARSRWADVYVYAAEGEAYGAIMGKRFARTDDGQIIVDEKTGMPTYDTDLSVLGNGNQDFNMGWRHQFTYKTLTVSALLDMKWGAKLYSMTSALAANYGTSKRTLEGREGWYASEQARQAAGIEAGAWRATGGYLVDGVYASGTDAEGNPIYVKNDIYVDPQEYWQTILTNTAEPFIYDASYIKLREISVSYTFPRKWFLKTPIESISLSVFGRNLWTIYSNLDNIDPESCYNNGNGRGLELGSLPGRRTYGIGLNIKF